MVIYVCLAALMDENLSFTDVTAETRELFCNKDAVCRVHLDKRMELSLALLTSSVALTDLRVAFILRMQSIVVLVSDF